MEAAITQTITAEIWVCENGHYFGSTGTHGQDLTQEPMRPKPENLIAENPEAYHARTRAEQARILIDQRGSRATCQVCREMGKGRVERVKRSVEVELP
jgi:hypothetical protein